MTQSRQRKTIFIIFVTLSYFLVLASAVSANDFTIGLKVWNASLSSDTVDGGEDLFFPGFYFSWNLNERIWISAGHIEGEVDFVDEVDENTRGSIEEVDSDIIFGWSFPKLDFGVGYRQAKFSIVLTDMTFPIESNGPMIFLGGGNLFGQSRTGYYWGVAYMFEDMEDEDGSQEHVNGEAGLRWTTQNNLSFMVGYRYKEYSGDGLDGASFGGPVVNIAFTWR